MRHFIQELASYSRYFKGHPPAKTLDFLKIVIDLTSFNFVICKKNKKNKTAVPVWMVFALVAYLTTDASQVRVRSLRGRLPLLYMPRATGSPVAVETWRHAILRCLPPFAMRGPSRAPGGYHSNTMGRHKIFGAFYTLSFFFDSFFNFFLLF